MDLFKESQRTSNWWRPHGGPTGTLRADLWAKFGQDYYEQRSKRAQLLKYHCPFTDFSHAIHLILLYFDAIFSSHLVTGMLVKFQDQRLTNVGTEQIQFKDSSEIWRRRFETFASAFRFSVLWYNFMLTRISSGANVFLLHDFRSLA